MAKELQVLQVILDIQACRALKETLSKVLQVHVALQELLAWDMKEDKDHLGLQDHQDLLDPSHILDPTDQL